MKWRPKKKVICPECRWRGKRAINIKPCPKCGHCPLAYDNEKQGLDRKGK